MSGYSISIPLFHRTWQRSSLQEPWPTAEITIPEGWWMLLTPLEAGEGKDCRVIAPDTIADPVDCTPYPAGGYLCVSRKPFGVIGDGLSNPFHHWNESAPRFRSARQIHKGELGQFISTEKVVVAQTVIHPSETESRKEETRHWVCLAEIAKLTGKSPAQIATDYSYFYDVESWESLLVVIADGFDNVSADCGEHLKNRSEFGKLISEVDASTIWMTARFARTVLRLEAVGYKPLPRELA